MNYARRSAQVLGLKLLILSVSFAAIAEALPEPAQASLENASWGGMKLLHIIMGTMGAGMSLWFLPQFTGRWLGATVTCGIGCAAVLTPLAAWAFQYYFKIPMPGPAENAAALAIGVGGVYIIPGFQKAVEGFRSNPMGFLDWLRGKGPPDGGKP
jgi:predicted Na+-dependent transporter